MVFCRHVGSQSAVSKGYQGAAGRGIITEDYVRCELLAYSLYIT
jgi:hypothetical protein